MKYKKNLLRSLLLAMCISVLPQQSYAMDGMAALLELTSSNVENPNALKDKGYSLLAKCSFAFGTVLAGWGIYKLIKYYTSPPQQPSQRSKTPSQTSTPQQPQQQHRSVREENAELFQTWKKRCDNLPKDNASYKHTALTLNDLMRAVRNYKKIAQQSTLTNNTYWYGRRPAIGDLCSEKFVPYIQKLCVIPGAKVAFHGDLHGDVHALNDYIADLNSKGYLDGFKIVKNNFYMLFLGDYTDRGGYGAEIWYTILQLKLANPDRVFMVRGNHEDKDLNKDYGFMDELKTKFGQYSTQDYQELYNLYNLLPVALYLGSGTAQEMNYLQCCHGGLEIGYDPQPLLQTTGTIKYQLLLDQGNRLDRRPGLAKLPRPLQDALNQSNIPTHHLAKRTFNCPSMIYKDGTTNAIGFMWNDFAVDNRTIINYSRGRGWECGKTFTERTLASHSSTKHKVRGVSRAHQHGDRAMMNRILNLDRKGHAYDAGIGKLWTDHRKIKQPGALWDGIVCTFLVAPAYYGKHNPQFDYDAFGLLTTAPKFDNWQLEVTRLDQSAPSINSFRSGNSSGASSSSQ